MASERRLATWHSAAWRVEGALATRAHRFLAEVLARKESDFNGWQLGPHGRASWSAPGGIREALHMIMGHVT